MPERDADAGSPLRVSAQGFNPGPGLVDSLLFTTKQPRRSLTDAARDGPDAPRRHASRTPHGEERRAATRLDLSAVARRAKAEPWAAGTALARGPSFETRGLRPRSSG
jgi:hypothetical protein